MVTQSDIFVGREEALDHFFRFIERGTDRAFIVYGEPGTGGSRFLREVESRFLADEKYVVGHYNVLKSVNVSKPFTDVLQNLMENLVAKGFKPSGLDRIRGACDCILEQSGSFTVALLKGLFKDIIKKATGDSTVSALSEIQGRVEQKNSVYDLTVKYLANQEELFVEDFAGVLNALATNFNDKEFVLVLDQFEQAPEKAFEIFIDLMALKKENVHLVFAFSLGNDSLQKWNRFHWPLVQNNAAIERLHPLTRSQVDTWLKSLNLQFSEAQLDRIMDLSLGLPSTLSGWVNAPKKCDLAELESLTKFKDLYCAMIFFRLPADCGVVVRIICGSGNRPFPVSKYEKLTGFDRNRFGMLMNKLVDHEIFKKVHTDDYDTFWFNHDSTYLCVRDRLSPTELASTAACALKTHLQTETALASEGKSDPDLKQTIAYCAHIAGDERSATLNGEFAKFCQEAGLHDVAETSYLCAIEDAEKLGNGELALSFKRDLADVYEFEGEREKASLLQNEIEDATSARPPKLPLSFIVADMQINEVFPQTRAFWNNLEHEKVKDLVKDRLKSTAQMDPSAEFLDTRDE